ncbi:MAG: carbohydrate kinase family protein [Clostridia bacterium]|nr:carbohydrate kinase family protein [Clostridia bacterium]MBR6810755.1 carbohydrate kinase family protein [Clostridia bacterium]
MKNEVYLHGQVLGTHSFLLRGEFPKPDSYSEIDERYFLPGGETGTAATVLSSLGVQVKIDGTHIGTEPADLIRSFYADKSVDLSSLYFDPEWEGLVDHVLITGAYRTPLGRFQHLYEIGIKRWNAPKEQDIMDCKAAGIDPYFGDETRQVAELCVKHHKPYVTIDCRHDSYLHQHSAINVLSHECTDGDYKGCTLEEVYDLLTQSTEGLVIITAGEHGMYFGRKGQEMKHMPAFKVDVRSTLGAGDTYKAGCVYALLHGMSDEETVRFAAACSGVAISRFPLPLNPPTLEEVNALLNQDK